MRISELSTTHWNEIVWTPKECVPSTLRTCLNSKDGLVTTKALGGMGNLQCREEYVDQVSMFVLLSSKTCGPCVGRSWRVPVRNEGQASNRVGLVEPMSMCQVRQGQGTLIDDGACLMLTNATADRSTIADV